MQKKTPLKKETKKEPLKKDRFQTNIKCLGPVADLERHLPVDWWRSIFNSIYLKTDSDVIENDRATENEISCFLNITQAEPSDYILDLCCGQGRHALNLAGRCFRFIFGIDRSRFLIRLARTRAQQLSLPVKFSEGDARKIRVVDQSMDYVMIMGNSFGYFEQKNDDVRVLREANRVLREGGILYLDVTDGAWMKENFEKRSWEWLDAELMVCRERNLSSDNSRLISREVVNHTEKGVIADQFYAERLYTFEELKNQLLAAGFTDIKKHQNLQGCSSRNQDLGMMANRNIITAVSPTKKTIFTQSKNLKQTHCTVLMGDPRLPDAVKRNGQFNEEDFETIRRLKNALASLKEYKFTFFDDHKSFIQKFLQNPPDFVLNLCDEGWSNNPFMELHPPAFMEMLGISYTGAGPDCLSLCYNKSVVRAIAQDMEIYIPSEIWIDPVSQSSAIPSIFPAMIKPAYGDSSFGITQNSVVYSAEELVTHFDALKTEMPNMPILIQEFLVGREFSVGVVGNNDSAEVLPILEVDYSKLPSDLPQILGYESKWLPSSPYWTNISYHQADLDESEKRYLTDAALSLFHRLKCRDYARFDFRMDINNVIKLLEVNPNPGWCWDGKMAMMAEFCGMDYAQLLQKILNAGLERYSTKI